MYQPIHKATEMVPKAPQNKPKVPAQRKTTLKWKSNGDLSAVDMARILEKLSNPELTECDLTCERKD